ncbi:MAG: O-antigen ligase family protein [Azoarcus sp.]|jgi:O-antigen ligase|nr:O-antigen ligase family protein [Azoarcus sp.]
MAFPDSMYLNQSSKNNVRQWLGLVFASLAFVLPLVWFVSGANDAIIDKMIRVMFVLFLLGIGQKAPQVYYKDRLIWLCALLALILVVGYIWQCFSVPEELFNGSKARKFLPAFCFFVVMAYGISAAPKVSPFFLLITAGTGLLFHLSSVPADVWMAAWQGKRLDFGLANAQHAGVIFSTALLAGVFFLPRTSSLPFKARMLVLPLLVGFILLMVFGVIATQTRAVWLGLALSVISLLLFCAVPLLTGRCSVHWRALAWVAATGVGILLAGSVMLYFMGGSVTQRLSAETIDTATIKEMAQLKTVKHSSVGIRIGSWSAAREWIAERPVFGWGGCEVSKLIKQSPHFDEDFKKEFKHLHNSYLETLVNVGSAAFICMIAIAFLVAWRTIMTWRQGQMPTDVFLFSCAFFLFWLTVNIFEPYIINAAGFFLNAVIGGFVCSWCLRSQHDQAELKIV